MEMLKPHQVCYTKRQQITYHKSHKTKEIRLISIGGYQWTKYLYIRALLKKKKHWT